MTEHSEVGWAYKVLYTELDQCGCGDYYGRMYLLRKTLNDIPFHENDKKWRKYNRPLYQWLLCLIDGAGMLEHGGSIGGSWLTEKGKRFLAVLNDEDSWISLLEDDTLGFCECEDCNPKP